ncbi:MAG: hypothetical protein LC105_04295 [Chitinophagales bacterium]|nr:hypothetical protein [Chitinophagales bacterium]
MIELDINKSSINITPPRIRSYEWIAIINALNTPFKHLLNDFYKDYGRIKYEMAFNGQKLYLEQVLNDRFNDRFDEVQRRIEIADFYTLPLYVFNQSENNEPVYLHNHSENNPLYLYNRIEVSGVFLVKVPIELKTYEILIRSILNRYKIQGKKYKIIYV